MTRRRNSSTPKSILVSRAELLLSEGLRWWGPTFGIRSRLCPRSGTKPHVSFPPALSGTSTVDSITNSTTPPPKVQDVKSLLILALIKACRGEDRTNLVEGKELPQEDPNSLNEDEDSDISGTETETTDEHLDDDISDAEVEDLLAEEREYVARHEIQNIFPEMEESRQYSTQKCLLGLKRGWDLDEGRPNVSSHSRATSITRHPVNHGEFASLVGERLRQDCYRHSDALDNRGKVGNTGVLFKVELPPYGYTFVGKGTVQWGLDRLRHESLVYSRLERLQGEAVPVHLGIVGLVPDEGYIIPGGFLFVHMMLMSWGGNTANETAAGICASDLATEVKRSSDAVWAEGVDYFDGHDGSNNLLWNEERGRVMLINFDRSSIRVTR